jgi:hypothetical protein
MVQAYLLTAMFLVMDVPDAGRSPAHPGDFPLSVRGGAWTLEDSARTYAGEELFQLIDGGAPLYFEYGFLLARSARYRCASADVVAAEAYEMRTEAGAYGLFTYLSAGSGTPAKFGQAAVEGAGFLLACRGRQVWSFTAIDGVGMDSVSALAREFVGPAAVMGTSLPVIRRFTGLFPGAQEPVLFFGPQGFQKRAPLSPARSMTIGSGVSALIPEGEVVMLAYSSILEAGVGYDSLVCSLGLVGKPASGPGAWRLVTRDGRELLVARKGECVVILAGPDRERLLALWHRLEGAPKGGER